MCDPVVAYLNRLCTAPANPFGPEFLAEHLLVVEQFAGQLACILGADQRMVRIASLLHDVAAIEDASQIPVHVEAFAWYQSLVEHNWNGLIDPARQIVAADHAAVRTLLR